jgi:hypothetical protein
MGKNIYAINKFATIINAPKLDLQQYFNKLNMKINIVYV